MELGDSSEEFSLVIEEVSIERTERARLIESEKTTPCKKEDMLLINCSKDVNGEKSNDSMGVIDERTQSVKHSSDESIDGRRITFNGTPNSLRYYGKMTSDLKTAKNDDDEDTSKKITLTVPELPQNLKTNDLKDISELNTGSSSTDEIVVDSDQYDDRYPALKRRKVANDNDTCSMSAAPSSDEDSSNSGWENTTVDGDSSPSNCESKNNIVCKDSKNRTLPTVARKHCASRRRGGNSNGVISALNSSSSEGGSKQKVLENGDVINNEIDIIERMANGGDMYNVDLNIQPVSRDALKTIFKRMSKSLSRNQLEDMLVQKICEVINESSKVGELKKCNTELQQRDKQRKLTIENLEKQVHQLIGVHKVYTDKVEHALENRYAVVPTMITRSVGLQVCVDSSAFVNTNECSSRSSTPAPDRSNEPIIDLTDKDDKMDDTRFGGSSSAFNAPESVLGSALLKKETMNVTGSVNSVRSNNECVKKITRHPPPLPHTPVYPREGLLPPGRPNLTIAKNENGVSLSWTMITEATQAKTVNYEIYVYQQTNAPAQADPWQFVGQVNAMPLPMECTLTQLFPGYKYYFSIRAVDELGRNGPFSYPSGTAL